MRRALLAASLLYAIALVSSRVDAQHAGVFMGSAEDPAIRYSTVELSNPVANVNKRLQEGTLELKFEGTGGFLRTALEALQVAADTQLLVFSQGSLQGKQIDEQNPRALYFNDRIAVGWVRAAPLLEVAVQDQAAGVVFYTLDQRADIERPPQFKRAFICLGCHRAGDTLGVPGFLMFSSSRPDPSQGLTLPRLIDQTDPLERRFGGWLVTGSTGPLRHMGNDVPALTGRPSRELDSVDRVFQTDGYRSFSSDIVAHLVFTHQAGMMNLLTRANWQARAADPTLHPPFTSTPDEEARVATVMRGIAREVVDYMLFIDEAKLSGGVRGDSHFADRFANLGPRTAQGRSLRDFDLNRRLMRYPCSYLIYSPAFDGLPSRARNPIYARLWEVLSGQEQDARYTSALSLDDRRAIVDILRETKPDLPSYFQDAIR